MTNPRSALPEKPDDLRTLVERFCHFNCDAESSCECGVHQIYRAALSQTTPRDLRAIEEQVINDFLHDTARLDQIATAMEQRIAQGHPLANDEANAATLRQILAAQTTPPPQTEEQKP